MNYKLCFISIMALLGLASCNESDDTPEEFPNWKSYNETFVQKLATDSVGHGWERIINYSYVENENGAPGDYIYIKRIWNGAKDARSPISTDSVDVHYQGRLLPSTTYKTGYVFDQSWLAGTQLDLDLNSPVRFSVGGVVDGFSTALQNMVVGDRWLVYVPQQLGYGSSKVSGITDTEYSTMLFDITLSRIVPKK